MRVNEKEFSDMFAKNYEKNRKKIEKATEGLRRVPYRRLHLPIS